MNVREKLVIVERAIKSISTHDDEDSALIAAALDKIDAMTQAERERIASKHAESIAALDEPAPKAKK